MIAKAEYVTNSKELQRIADEYTLILQEELKDILHIKGSIEIARRIGRQYRKDIRKKTVYGMAEVGLTAARHYNKVLGLDLTEDELAKVVETLINQQLTTKYHNLTLEQRFTASDILLNRNINRSAYVGLKLETRQANLVRVFNNRFPFGAHINVDNRILLSEAVRLEHMIARELAGKTDVVLAKWTLSEKHVQEDICDHLAEKIDKETVDYIKQHNLTIKPEGVYLIKNIPDIPHPNCQCTIRFFRRNELTTGRIRRTGERIRDLLERLLGRKKLTLKV